MKKISITLGLLILIILPLSACGSDSITVGTQTNTEIKITAEMYKLLIENDTDVSVDIKTDLSTTPVIVQGMESDDIQMATQYTGTSLASFAPSIENPEDPEATLEQARQVYKDEFNIKWFDSLGFANNYAIAVREEVAEEHDLETISDLRDIAEDMTAAFDTSWLERDNDGYDAFKEAYDIDFGETNPMEIGLVYDAIDDGNVDVALAYTADARIDKYNLALLEDDKSFFPPYDASPVVKQETLDDHPEIADAIEPLLGRFDDEKIRELAGEVDIDGKDTAEVAENYLKDEGLLD